MSSIVLIIDVTSSISRCREDNYCVEEFDRQGFPSLFMYSETT